jgi:hypothetical protein
VTNTTDKLQFFDDLDAEWANHTARRNEQVAVIQQIEAAAHPTDEVRPEMVELLLADDRPEHIHKMANPAEFAAAQTVRLAQADRAMRAMRLMSMAGRLVAPYWPDGGTLGDAINAAPPDIAADAQALLAGSTALDTPTRP